MKYIKLYETINIPKIGDYVICQDKETNEQLEEFTQNNIGEIIDIDKHPYKNAILDNFGINWEGTNWDYYVIFNNIPKDIQINFQYNVRAYSREEINFFSSDYEDVEAYIEGTKYNL